jgi:hypothetical protein
MKILLISGIIYLLGVAIILWMKPELMFREDGTWKEFGIGRDRENYTWFPFWLFILFWSLISYGLTYFMMNGNKTPVHSESDKISVKSKPTTPKSKRTIKQRKLKIKKNKITSPSSKRLTPGYYILNKDASKKAGVPKYVYVGKTAPPSTE